ncbi:hypothetical protein [Sphingomonas sp.]|uniref:hypothetical protein n=1 Tax=Sphingomonas sp. TaxID=28214 RepID=UPI0031DF7255
MTAMTHAQPYVPPHAGIAPRRHAPGRRALGRPADGGDRLVHMLTGHAARAGADVTIGVLTVEPWCSATFSGSVFTLSLTGCRTPAFSRWLADLAEADLPMGRDVIADIAIEPTCAGHFLRVLTCADAAKG